MKNCTHCHKELTPEGDCPDMTCTVYHEWTEPTQPFLRKVEAYQSKDGTTHGTLSEAVRHDLSDLLTRKVSPSSADAVAEMLVEGHPDFRRTVIALLRELG